MKIRFRTPIFIQAGLGKNAQPLEELLARWNMYGGVLDEVTNHELQKIVVFMPQYNQPLNLDSFVHLEVHFFPNSWMGRLQLIIQLHKCINKLTQRSVTLVAGDSYVSPILARFIKLICDASIRIQVQFHGASYIRLNKNITSLFRYHLVRLAIYFSDSIRIVSTFQEYEIQRITSSKQKDYVVSPIPISMSRIPNLRIPHTGLTILVLGRLHPERGIVELVELIDLLINEKVDCIVNVVGEGPLRNLLVPYTQNPDRPTKVILHGLRSELEVSEYLAQSDILISMAEQEGYGLALREAILSGVHVIAKRNSGTQEALAAFPNRMELIDSTPEALTIIKNFKPRQIDDDTLMELRATQELLNLKAVRDLVGSWIKN